MLIRSRVLLLSILIASMYLFSCMKEKSIQKIDSQILSEVKEWYTKTPHTTESPDWSQATIISEQGSNKVIVPYILKVKGSSGNRMIRRMVFNKNGATWEGQVTLVIASLQYGVTHKGINKLDFTGYTGIFDLNMKFQHGWYYENGVRKHEAIFESYNNQAAYEKKAKPEMQCNYYQYTYTDDDGVFTVVGYSVCTPDQGGRRWRITSH